MVFSKDSPVLVMHINVYEQKPDGSLCKIISDVTVDEQVSIQHGDKCVDKKLACVIYHIGRTKDSGHYFARILGPNGTWYEANDEKVTVVSGPGLSRRKDVMPYLLFYTTSEPLPDSIHIALRTMISRFDILPLIDPNPTR